MTSPDRKQFDEMVAALQNIAVKLVTMMGPGQTIEVVIPVKSSIILPNQQPQFETILITRPAIKVEIKSQIHLTSQPVDGGR